MTALAPAIRDKAQAALGQAEALARAAQSLTIRNATEAQLATEFVARVAAIKKANETDRRSHTDPLNAEVKAINAAFKEPVELLEQADGVVRRALVGYNQEQERLRQEEAARLQREREEAERGAAAERQRLADEAAARERAAAEAEAARQAELALAANERRRELAELDDDELTEIWRSDQHEDAVMAHEELEARRRQAAAEAEAQAARDREAAAQLASLTVQAAPAVEVTVATPLRAVSGSAAATKRWTYEVQDLRELARAIADGKAPVEFIQPAAGELRKFVNGGGRDLAGVRIYQADGLAVRSAS